MRVPSLNPLRAARVRPLNTVQTQEIQIQDLVSVHSIFSINDQWPIL